MTNETLRGTIERITYHNEETGYTVAQLQPEGRGYLVTVVGNMLGMHVGASVAVEGAWAVHPQHGRQFQAGVVHAVLPATAAGIERYLGSGLIKGIGPVTARRIVRRFGVETLRIIEEEPGRLAEVEGVGRVRAELITRAWEEQRKIKEVMLFLQGHGVSTGLAVRIYRQYGDDAIEVVRSDPYRLARDVFGIGFLTSDRIARAMGIPADAPQRLAAGLSYALSQATDEGHSYLPQVELAARGAELLQVELPLVEAGLVRAAAEELVFVEVAEGAPVYLPALYRAELGVAGRVRRLLAAGDPAFDAFRRADWHLLSERMRGAEGGSRQLTGRQLDAVRAALTRKVSVLTGGPGTGKTTTVRSVIGLAEAAGARVVLASPTGRAAKRMAEATGRPAKTIHRLLEFKGAGGFQRNDDHPLEADLVIVDESSMLDLLLANALLKAIPPEAHLLLVGDADQLPSVGAGNVLHDVVAALESYPLLGGEVIRLNAIFRQPEGSRIITNAHRINRGEMPLLDNKTAQDFFLFTEEDPEAAAALVADLVADRMPRRFGLRPADIQVLSPMHRGAAGVGALNVRLQAALNPARPGLPERTAAGRTLRVGDRLMQIRNNYDKEVFNGDMGVLEALDFEDQVAVVRMDERPVSYDFADLDELVHAFAVSIHKAQGSEFPAVVLALLPGHYVMLQRNLLYTGVTRARRVVVLVGSARAVAIAVKNAKAKARYSRLAERIARG